MTRENIAQFCPKTRKIGYGKRKRALTAVARLGAHLGEEPLRVYKCAMCRRWHMTSQAKLSRRHERGRT